MNGQDKTARIWELDNHSPAKAIFHAHTCLSILWRSTGAWRVCVPGLWYDGGR